MSYLAARAGEHALTVGRDQDHRTGDCSCGWATDSTSVQRILDRWREHAREQEAGEEA